MNLEDGGLWLHIQDDGHVIMRTKDESDEYNPLYPETQAKYVIDAAGANLQTKIYQHYFERDDVITTLSSNDNETVYTSLAKLISNPNIVVAKEIVTNNLEINDVNIEDQWISEFTAYDETGVYVMYKCRCIFNEYADGSFDKTPEVII